MGRPPRIDFEGAWHHVLNRGTNHQRLFFTSRDGDRFLTLVAQGCDRFGVETHAFCLMSNHFHLLLHTPVGGLSRFVHFVASQYARAVNPRVGRDGPMFRSRFRSRLVDTPRYRAQAGRYIHLNAKDMPGVADLARYRWSSYRFYLGVEPAPDWLRTGVLLDAVASPMAYRSYVEGELERSAPDAMVLLEAINLVLDQSAVVRGQQRRGARRALALTALDLLDRSGQEQVLTALELEEGSALRAARQRAVQTLQQTPGLMSLLQSALDLAG